MKDWHEKGWSYNNGRNEKFILFFFIPFYRLSIHSFHSCEATEVWGEKSERENEKRKKTRRVKMGKKKIEMYCWYYPEGVRENFCAVKHKSRILFSLKKRRSNDALFKRRKKVVAKNLFGSSSSSITRISFIRHNVHSISICLLKNIFLPKK